MTELVVGPDEVDGLLRVRASGFVTRDLLRNQLRAYWSDAPAVAGAAVVDLRNVAGYGYGCGALALAALRDAANRGVKQIALVSESSVLRTVISVMAADEHLELRCFHDPDVALGWIRNGDSVPAQAS